MAASRRFAGQSGQLDPQSRSHDAPDCGSYILVQRVGPSTWAVRYTAACDASRPVSTLRFVSRAQFDRYF